MRILAIAAIILFSFCGAASAALLEGETLTFQNLFPTQDTPFPRGNDGEYLVGAGVEVPAYLSGRLAVDISDTEIQISYTGGGALSMTTSEFNGFSLTDTFGTIADFVSLSLIEQSNVSGAVGLSFLADILYINLSGLVFIEDGFLRLSVNNPNEIPLPAALPLFIAGLSGIGLFGRGRKKLAA